MLRADLNGDGLRDFVMLNRFAPDLLAYQLADGAFRVVRAKWSGGMDLRVADVNSDQRADIITSAGEVILSQPDDQLAQADGGPLDTPKGWTWNAVADFDGDGRNEVVLLARAERPATGLVCWVFENTRNPKRPFAKKPSRTFNIPEGEILRVGPTVADWNGDGVADLILSADRRTGAMVLMGGPKVGLSPERAYHVKLDFLVHYDTEVGVADFNRDGRPDLACFGQSHRTVPGVFIWLQPKPNDG